MIRDRMGRRAFVAGVSGLALSCSPPAEKKDAPKETPRRRPVILLRSVWRPGDVGDLARTLGLLRLIGTYILEADLYLWSGDLTSSAAALLKRSFPKAGLVSGDTGADGSPDDAGLAAAFDRADLLVDGSAAGVAAPAHLEAWRKRTGKPYGILGASLDGRLGRGWNDVLEGASFVFARETRSLENLKQAGVRGPKIGFAPDAAFSLKVSDEQRALDYLKRNGLEAKRFLAVAPGIGAGAGNHGKFREAIEAWVRETDQRVLLCAETTDQLGSMDPLLYDPLPEAVKRSTVRRKTLWLPDEAASVYRRAVAVLSFSCRSPIVAAANDTPPVYVHVDGAGSDGRIWKDIGLNRWHFEAERTSGLHIAAAVAKIRQDYAAAQVDTHEAVTYARKLQSDAMESVVEVLGGRR